MASNKSLTYRDRRTMSLVEILGPAKEIVDWNKVIHHEPKEIKSRIVLPEKNDNDDSADVLSQTNDPIVDSPMSPDFPGCHFKKRRRIPSATHTVVESCDAPPSKARRVTLDSAPITNDDDDDDGTPPHVKRRNRKKARKSKARVQPKIDQMFYKKVSDALTLPNSSSPENGPELIKTV